MKQLLSALAISAMAFLSSARADSPMPDSLKVSGFAVGCQAYTFNRFSVFEAIEKTASTGAKVIEFYPGQKLSPAEPNVKFSHDAAPEVWDKVKAKLKEAGITPVAYGVVGLSKDEAVSRNVFEFAKSFGIRVINTESVDAIDTFEQLVKEYDIKVGFHDHPKRPDDVNYKLWDPNYVLSLVKDRDIRIGACADVGHWVRSGLKPVECVKILKGRVVSRKTSMSPNPSAMISTGVKESAVSVRCSRSLQHRDSMVPSPLNTSTIGTTMSWTPKPAWTSCVRMVRRNKRIPG
jgi:hypothetical protein